MFKVTDLKDKRGGFTDTYEKSPQYKNWATPETGVEPQWIHLSNLTSGW